MPWLNCWEFKGCGREPGGARADELGICPAATATGIDGANNGKNGGRACWAITGTLCGGSVQGTFAEKLDSCPNCNFYRLVTAEKSESSPQCGKSPAKVDVKS
jgi:hypothetical protein